MALGGARHPELRALLSAIVAGQRAKIAQMLGWYREWYGTPGAARRTVTPQRDA